MRDAGGEALQRLVVDDPRLADTGRLEDPPRPELPARAREYERSERRGARETRQCREGGPHPSRQQQVDGEDGGGEFDARGDADGDALAACAVGPPQVPQDGAGQQQVDLPEEGRLEDRFQPQAGGGGGQQERQAHLPSARYGGEAQGQMHEQHQQDDVAGEERGLRRTEGEPGDGNEQQRRERRVGRRQLPRRDGEAVQIRAAGDGLPLRPVDVDVRHRKAVDRADGGERREGEGEQCGRVPLPSDAGSEPCPQLWRLSFRGARARSRPGRVVFSGGRP
ncbi:hypothetical protein GCM10012287_16000 [Streptomyces daqingensis]|uniref:Uncharacterized protein n=1 Tax=Streptomyces daqingensis TaxID=1472640 RepID=A0ABQ2M383_9ACTN|nr:hypothetical protein GCM10012287_16000 [Streptomyces daqingensis]